MSAAQRTDGSRMVDIYYDLANGEGAITVSVLISPDGGTTWSITPQAQYLSGDVGVVTNGTGKHIVWDMFADQPEVCWPDMDVRIIVEDESPEELTIMLPGDVPLVLVKIPAGTFMMGRYSAEQDSSANEDPQHEVTISQDFYMGKYEITQQQWLAVMGSWPGTAPLSANGLGDNYPAYYVSWDDAQNFVGVLNTHITNTGQGPASTRLPSEAEWEYACRADTTTRFYWGDDLSETLIGDYAWYTDNNDPYGTKPVGGKLINAFGLYDMSGNVWEWCDDDWHSNYTAAPADGSAWVDGPRAAERLVRGGNWDDVFNYCRSADRNPYTPTTRNAIIGFRVARTP